MQTIYNELKAPFEKEAYKIDKSRGKNNLMTSISAQYIIDRLNIVLGLGRWELTGNYELGKDESGKVSYVIFYGRFEARVTLKDGSDSILREILVENVGYSEQNGYKLIGDMLKSAKTDCLSKCASWIGVGDDVFKGKVAPGAAPRPVIDPVKNQVISQIKNLSGIITKDCSNEEKLEFMHNQLEVKSFNDLLEESIDKLNGKRMALEAMAQVVR